MAEIDVLKAQLVRQDAAVGWGLSLVVSIAGGAGPALAIQRILPGSPASRIGLQPGDMVTEIGEQKTCGMTVEQASKVINQHPESLILTIERKARGAIPGNPLVQAEMPQLKHYQTFDMTGTHPRKRTRQIPPQHHQPVDYSHLDTAVSRPFEEPVRSSYHQPAPAQPHYPSLPPLRPPPRQFHHHYFLDTHKHLPPQCLVPEEEKMFPMMRHSKTFKVLSTPLSYEEPYVGVQGLPPPRSATMERMKQEWADNHPGQQRVKVFMPQQYNNPMSLYSAPNVVETFAAQAEGLMDEIESQATTSSHDGQQLSGAQKAVLEEQQS